MGPCCDTNANHCHCYCKPCGYCNEQGKHATHCRADDETTTDPATTFLTAWFSNNNRIGPQVVALGNALDGAYRGLKVCTACTGRGGYSDCICSACNGKGAVR